MNYRIRGSNISFILHFFVSGITFPKLSLVHNNSLITSCEKGTLVRELVTFFEKGISLIRGLKLQFFNGAREIVFLHIFIHPERKADE